jgi:hypothetical protein
MSGWSARGATIRACTAGGSVRGRSARFPPQGAAVARESVDGAILSKPQAHQARFGSPLRDVPRLELAWRNPFGILAPTIHARNAPTRQVAP